MKEMKEMKCSSEMSYTSHVTIRRHPWFCLSSLDFSSLCAPIALLSTCTELDLPATISVYIGILFLHCFASQTFRGST
ncbi:hypothetical protein ACN38_g5784 [Penicillium nordicum]|uniref:Uncharacterized protein n=1 Tax=Penicillium nordicum TaxID=229535 RepID=A0A0M8P9T2_9EURO|nr:hypothetical protein ACN38_g5784 [Penicillium nordicum]